MVHIQSPDMPDAPTDFRFLWSKISSQKNSGLPVRRCFFCDCGYRTESHARLFVHTSDCPEVGYLVRWGNALVGMPRRELAALHLEWKALVTDATIVQQIWLIAYHSIKLRVCPIDLLKRKFLEVAAWYGFTDRQAESLLTA